MVSTKHVMGALYKDMGILFIILFFSGVLLIYFGKQMYKIITDYQTAANAPPQIARVQTNPLTDKTQDNEVYAPSSATLANATAGTTYQYAAITQSIQNTFSTFTTYNSQMASYYKNVLKKDPEDLMDSSVLIAENDDWNPT